MYMFRLSLIEGIVLDYDAFSLARAYLRPTIGSTIPFVSTLSNRNGSLYGPRYKIFAVLNLAYDSAKIVPSPNYTLSVDEVYKQRVVSLITESGRLDSQSCESTCFYSTTRHARPLLGTRLDFQNHQHCQFVRSGREKSLGR